MKDLIREREDELAERTATFRKAGIDAELAAEYARTGVDPRRFLTPEPGATHLRIQCINGSKHGFARCGRIWTATAEYVSIDEFAPHELNELLGEHLNGTLAVEQFRQDARGNETRVKEAAPVDERPADKLAKLTKPSIKKHARKLGIKVTNQTKATLLKEIAAVQDEGEGVLEIEDEGDDE